MRSHRLLRSYAVLSVLVLVALPVAAQSGGDKPAAGGEQEAMMKAFMEAATPGAQQHWLAEAAGDWKVTVKSWMDPSAPPEVTQGTSHREMILGGRYLSEKVEGTMMDQPFHGQGLTGYDNVKKVFCSTWVDSMGTGITISEGTLDRATQTLTWQAEYTDPITKQPTKSKMVSQRMGNDKEVFSAYENRGGTEVKTMEITYERVK
jgi:Protein of unknown function (DUF1579)